MPCPQGVDPARSLALFIVHGSFVVVLTNAIVSLSGRPTRTPSTPFTHEVSSAS